MVNIHTYKRIFWSSKIHTGINSYSYILVCMYVIILTYIHMYMLNVGNLIYQRNITWISLYLNTGQCKRASYHFVVLHAPYRTFSHIVEIKCIFYILLGRKMNLLYGNIKHNHQIESNIYVLRKQFYLRSHLLLYWAHWVICILTLSDWICVLFISFYICSFMLEIDNFLLLWHITIPEQLFFLFVLRYTCILICSLEVNMYIIENMRQAKVRYEQPQLVASCRSFHYYTNPTKIVWIQLLRLQNTDSLYTNKFIIKKKVRKTSFPAVLMALAIIKKYRDHNCLFCYWSSNYLSQFQNKKKTGTKIQHVHIIITFDSIYWIIINIIIIIINVPLRANQTITHI